MKIMTTIMTLILLVASNAHGAVLRGKIVLLNSGGKPVENVQVSAFGANTQVSTGTGLFELDFPGKIPGDVVMLIIQKKGFEVINKRDVERVVLRQNPDELLEIAMCLEGTWEKNVQVYYGIAAKAINDEFEKRLKKIESAIIGTKDTEIRRLTAERDAALAQAKRMAEDFAQVNLDEASDLYREAFGYFTKGDIDKALEVLNKEKLDRALKKTEERLRAIGEAYILGARLHRIKFNFVEAESYYDQALVADPGNLDNYLEFSAFLWDQRNFPKGEEICNKALAIKMEDGAKAAFLNNLGLLYNDTTRLTEAEQALAEALGIYRELAKTNPTAYLPDVAMTLNNLGNLYSDTTRLTAAEQAYAEALGIYRELAKTNPAAYLSFVATSLNNLGLLYSATTRLTAAEQAYAEALGIRRELAKTNPAAYLSDVATSLNNLGNLYYTTTRFTAAEQAYTEALGIKRELAKTNPAAYLPGVATSLNNLGNLYSATTRLTEAEQAYAEALGIRRELAQTNPAAYLPDVAMTLNNLGILYKNTTRLTAAEQAYAEALGIYRELAKTNPAAYLTFVATSLNNLGLLNINMNKYAAALSNLQEALNIRKELAAKYPSAFDLDLCRTILSLTIFYTIAPDACSAIREEVPPLLDLAISILKKYPSNPQAQKYLRQAEELKKTIK